jgi:hypothetical protein
MEKVTLTANQLEDIFKRLDSLERELAKKQPTVVDKFLDNQEFMQLMYISKRTAQNWREKGMISYSQIGGKIYYRMSDVQKLLDHNYKQTVNCNNLTKGNNNEK